jgi:hypothetical protein
MRKFKVHARACGPQGTGWRSLCGTDGTTGEDVTCHICLFRLGLYVPLVKLREHQAWNKFSALPRGTTTAAWAAHGMHSESP